MSNRGTDYQRMKKGESRKVLAIAQSRRDLKGKIRKTVGKVAGKSEK